METRLEFRPADDPVSLVIFPEHPDRAFWKEGNEIRFCYSTMTLASAEQFAEAGIVERSEVAGRLTYEDFETRAAVYHDALVAAWPR